MSKRYYILFILLILTVGAFSQESKEFVYVAHAFGSIAEHRYTNSRQAFNENYAKGHRYFETDFALSADQKLICTHPGEGLRYSEPTDDICVFTRREFMKMRIDGTFRTMDVDEILRLLYNYPDIHIITDTKGWSEELVKAFDEAFAKVSPAALRRIIIQIYRPEDYEMLQPLWTKYTFGGVIYTLYLLDTTYENVAKFVTEKKIGAIAVESLRLKRRRSTILWLQSHGVKVYVFTVNDPTEAESIVSLGLDGIYTDEL